MPYIRKCCNYKTLNFKLSLKSGFNYPSKYLSHLKVLHFNSDFMGYKWNVENDRGGYLGVIFLNKWISRELSTLFELSLFLACLGKCNQRDGMRKRFILCFLYWNRLLPLCKECNCHRRLCRLGTHSNPFFALGKFVWTWVSLVCLVKEIPRW